MKRPTKVSKPPRPQGPASLGSLAPIENEAFIDDNNDMRALRNIMFFFLLTAPILATGEGPPRRLGMRNASKNHDFFVGVGIGFHSVSQDGMNFLIREAKRKSAATNAEMKVAQEYTGFFGMKLPQRAFSILLKPSYFIQDSDGRGTGGDYDYRLVGYTAFPMLRYSYYAADRFDFYIQAGVGYARLEGRIKNAARSAIFKGDGVGTQISTGIEFNFFRDSYIGLEGNYRHLPIPRNIVSSARGLPDGIGQATPNTELENTSKNDVETGLSGLSAVFSYSFKF